MSPRITISPISLQLSKETIRKFDKSESSFSKQTSLPHFEFDN
jgi:hypothetical protein